MVGPKQIRDRGAVDQVADIARGMAGKRLRSTSITDCRPERNRLWYGGCLAIMRDRMRRASVDLIYLDPPFSSNHDYGAALLDGAGRPLPDQVAALCNRWAPDEERERAIREMPRLLRAAGIGDNMAGFWRPWMGALRTTQPRLLAYLAYMTERLLPMRRLLKPTCSIYLHCDPTASHYLKVVMDTIFGHERFRNEII